MPDKKRRTGLGSGTDAFFNPRPVATESSEPENTVESAPVAATEKRKRTSMNLYPSIALLLDEILLVARRRGEVLTKSEIIERGILLVAKEEGIGE